MDELILQFFPFPYELDGNRRDGHRYNWPERCTKCDHQCRDDTSRQVKLCSYGVNYVKFSERLLIAGMYVTDHGFDTKARSKFLRTARSNQVNSAEIEAAREKYNDGRLLPDDRKEEREDRALEAFRDSPDFLDRIVAHLRPQIDDALGRVHDYRQFVAQIRQQVNVILQRKFPGEEIYDQLEKATPQERAIYVAARLMQEKLESALLFQHPDRIVDTSHYDRFRFHGMVTKLLKIYRYAFELKEVTLSVDGSSYAYLRGNPEAIAVIPHALIDNAQKYAPAGSKVSVTFSETDERIRMCVAGYGPRIDEDEQDRIFEPFYRGRRAKDRSDGNGFGLALAKLVTQRIGAELIVEQDFGDTLNDLVWTTGIVEFSRASWVEADPEDGPDSAVVRVG